MVNEEKMVIEAMKKAKKPMRTGDIAKSTGLDSKEVSKIIKDLKKSGKVTTPQKCYYVLADK